MILRIELNRELCPKRVCISRKIPSFINRFVPEGQLSEIFKFSGGNATKEVFSFLYGQIRS